MNKRIALASVGFLALSIMSVGGANAAEDVPGSSPDNPIVVADPSEVPEGAVEDEVSTYETPEACDTTRSWVLTIPATDDVTHEEVRFKRDVPEVDEQSHPEYRWSVYKRTYEPGQQEQTHTEYKYQRQVPGQHHEAVTHTEYHFSKFTQTRSRTWVPKTDAVYGPDLWWNFSPNNSQQVFIGAPSWPTDSRGTWQGPHENGGPQQDEFGTFANGNPFKGGNWFHREHGALVTPAVPAHWGEWSAFGEWTQWTPVTHESWETSTDPLGSPAPHASWQVGNTQFERVWQARFDGGTRTVTDAEAYDDPPTTETSDWLTSPPAGEGWEVIDTRTVTDSEAIPASFGPWVWDSFTDWSLSDVTPADPDGEEGEDNPLNLVQIGEGYDRTVIDVEHADAYVLYFVLGGEPSLNEADATWVREEQAPAEGWTEFDRRTVTDEEGTPEVVTYYAYTDGAECEKPEGYEDTTSTEKCDNGDLVTTETTTTGTPVQAEDGSWTIEETATSSQSVEKDAKVCADKPEEPENPDTPSDNISTLPMTGRETPATVDQQSTGAAFYGGLAALLAGLVGLSLTLRRRGA